MSSAIEDAVRRTWIIVLNWKHARMTIKCVEGVLRAIRMAPVLIIDNGSGPGDWAKLTTTFEGHGQVQMMQTPGNLGYAGGMQWGIRRALQEGAEYIWLLNNDCSVTPGALTPLLIEMLEHPRTAACSGIIDHIGSGRNWHHGGGQLDPLRGRIVNAYRPDWLPLPRYSVDFVPGVAWLLRSTVIREIGGLDCRLFLTGEEPDWCYRARTHG
jgi:GT2 family glycosyltransferase